LLIFRLGNGSYFAALIAEEESAQVSFQLHYIDLVYRFFELGGRNSIAIEEGLNANNKQPNRECA
jgi:hypothetical protein